MPATVRRRAAAVVAAIERTFSLNGVRAIIA